jgi:hypothetical protein
MQNFMSTANFMCVCCFLPLEPLIIGHVIAMAVASQTSTKCKLLSIQEQLHFMNNVNAT